MTDETTQPDAGGISATFLRLADGTLIDPLTREPLASQPLKTKREEEQNEEELLAEIDAFNSAELTITAEDRTSIVDLPLQGSQMAFVNHVLVLTLYGLPDDEVAMACDCSIDQIIQIREHDAYKMMYRMLIDGIRRAYVHSVQGMLQDASVIAAKTVTHTIKKSKSVDLRFQASKDVLDRTGHRAADRVEHIHKVTQDSALTIRIIKEDELPNVPTIDITPTDA